MPCILVFGGVSARGADTRYSLWSGTVKGAGARTVGMAGATTGLADDYFGALDNPAGLSLTLSGINLMISSAGIQDELHTDPGVARTYYTAGLGLPIATFGAGIGYSVPFEAVGADGEEIRLSEYRFSVAKKFLNRASVGLGLAPSNLRVGGEDLRGLRVVLGALYRFPRRFFIGTAYSPSATLGPDMRGRSFSLPHQLSVGAAWIPNRFFRGSVSIRAIAPETDVFRFRDPSREVGGRWSGQYHIGVDYLYLSLKQIHGRVFAGTYLESTRANDTSRIHVTWGIEVNPWFLRFSAGMDTAPGYRNVTFGTGVDIADILRALRLHPPEVQEPAGGLLPNPFEVSDDWLPTQLQDNPDDAFQTIGPELEDLPKTIEKLPENIRK